jgi:hypothetical protein
VTNITCAVADLNLATGAPHIDGFSLDGKPAGDYFLDASGPGALRVAFDWSRRKLFPGVISLNGVSDFHLHSSLGKLLAPFTSDKPAKVGMLLADQYQAAPDQYGVMFDTNVAAGSYGPRQGCALFLTPLQLNTVSDSFAEFLAFTAIHELGHAFNLWHTDGAAGFMQSHPQPANLDPKSFDPHQTDYLALAHDSALEHYVLPGESAFGDRPSGWPSGDGSPFAGPERAAREISLRINLSHSSFWSYEPVELNIQLAPTAGRKKPIAVPDEIDPGYPSFAIWITKPDGERFRFRSDRRFCSPNGERVIKPGRPYRRDISVFRHAGQYTFRAPGRYEVQASVRLRSGQLVVSNIAECEVLAAAPSAALWKRLRSVLTTQHAMTLLRFKRGIPSSESYRQLASLATSQRTPDVTAAALHYSLGLAFARGAEQPNEKSNRKQFDRQARKHLEAAVSHRSLDRHRRTNAVAQIAKLDESSSG